MTALAKPKADHEYTLDDLTELQQAWVRHMIQLGNGVDAARAAGYGADSATKEGRDTACRGAAHVNERNPKIIAVLRKEAGIMLDVGVVIGARTLVSIANDPTHKDQYKAAIRLAELSGYQVVAKQEINVNHSSTDQATLLQRVAEIADRLGMDKQKLLEKYAPNLAPAPVVDAEFTVVDTPGSTKGLEDIL